MTDAKEELVVKDSGHYYKYYFDDHYFIREWRHGQDEGTMSISLDQLSNNFSISQGRPEGFVERLRIAGYFVAGAIIIYFSDYNESIPLLAPAFLIYGVSRIINMWSDVLPKTWTIIPYKSSGQTEAILHTESNRKREKFEVALSKAIQDADATSS